MSRSAVVAILPAQSEPNDDARDAALLDRVEQNDEQAFAMLVERWWRPLTRYCLAIVKTRPLCEDIVQEAFVRLWERRSSWRPQSSVRALLYTMVRNRAWNELRREGNHERTLGNGRASLNRRVNTPAEEMEGRELWAALESAIAKLSPRRREILLLSREEGLTHGEIARITGLSTQTVANYLFRALEELREELAPLLRS